jgi:hypothetical protein
MVLCGDMDSGGEHLGAMQLCSGPSRFDSAADGKIDFVGQLEEQVVERFDAVKVGVHERWNFIDESVEGGGGVLHRGPWCWRYFLGFGAVSAGDDDGNWSAASEIESKGARPNGREASEVVGVVHAGIAEAARKVLRVGEGERIPPEGTVRVGGIVGGPGRDTGWRA